MTQVVTRAVPEAAAHALSSSGIAPLLARIFAARGVSMPAQLDYSLNRLLPFQALKNCEVMAQRLADAIAQQAHIVVVADYDADGATACTCAVQGLRLLGARVSFIVPNRFEYGYGLSPEIVALAALQAPDIILTVDNGIASVEGVAAARTLGIEVLITDHHLPGDILPDALIVNPNQHGCTFPSKHLAGVGVMFYVLMALRAALRQRGAFTDVAEPNLAQLLDLVALGTVADVVQLDDNNRILVEQGLRRIRRGHACPGINALFRASSRLPQKANTFDLGFMLGPRLNAAGRLDDMTIGIECLLSPDAEQALMLAQTLDKLNRERRQIEQGMQEEALQLLTTIEPSTRHTLTLFRDDWHQGVVGIVASRLKERFHRPSLVFAPGDDGEIKGSGRSIAGFHLRDALDLVSKRHPLLLRKFGGHAMAAGVTLAASDFVVFQDAFESVAQELLPQGILTRSIETDGQLTLSEFELSTAAVLADYAWGQGFPAPAFSDRFCVRAQRIVGEKHLRLTLEKEGAEFEAMLFNHNEWLPEVIKAVFQLSVNEWQGKRSLQLLLDYWVAA